MITFGMILTAVAFVVGLIIGAYGHKWLSRKAAIVGVTPPTKLP